LVESKFWALQNVSITTSSLSRPRRNLGKDTSRSKLVVNLRLQSASGLTLLELVSNLGALALEIKLLRGISTLLQAALDSVVSIIPSLEGMGVYENNSTLDQSLGTDQFVVGGIVGNIQDTDLSRADLGTPGEVSRIQSEGAVLEVSSSSTDAVDASLTDTGVGGGATQFELALLAELRTASSSLAPLVSSFTCNTLN
jgi:hypothetical protein